MEHPILNHIRAASFTPLGWFEPSPSDGFGVTTKFVILIGNAGPQMFRRFVRERDPSQHGMDEWTKSVVDGIAHSLDARAVYPFDKPPHPFLTWARKAGAGYVSPLGLNIHPTHGLWHAYRAALLFPVVFDLPRPSQGRSPCTTCVEKPCLSACPVNAFDGQSYDVVACGQQLGTHAGEDCMTGGCKARLACPVGRGFIYSPQQINFHMKAFKKARDPVDV